jgi:hypothetical protein
MSLVEGMLCKVADCQAQPSANRVFWLQGPPQSGKTAAAIELARRASGTYVDLLADKLGDLDPPVGTYRPKHFQADVKHWARDAGSLLVIDEVEPLFDTWSHTQQEDAVRLLSGLTARTSCPVLVATRIPLDYDRLTGNKGRLFSTSGR